MSSVMRNCVKSQSCRAADSNHCFRARKGYRGGGESKVVNENLRANLRAMQDK